LRRGRRPRQQEPRERRRHEPAESPQRRTLLRGTPAWTRRIDRRSSPLERGVRAPRPYVPRTVPWLPAPLRALDAEIAERLSKAPLRLNGYGYDPYGLHPGFARTLVPPEALASCPPLPRA